MQLINFHTQCDPTFNNNFKVPTKTCNENHRLQLSTSNFNDSNNNSITDFQLHMITTIEINITKSIEYNPLIFSCLYFFFSPSIFLFSFFSSFSFPLSFLICLFVRFCFFSLYLSQLFLEIPQTYASFTTQHISYRTKQNITMSYRTHTQTFFFFFSPFPRPSRLHPNIHYIRKNTHDMSFHI